MRRYLEPLLIAGLATLAPIAATAQDPPEEQGDATTPDGATDPAEGDEAAAPAGEETDASEEAKDDAEDEEKEREEEGDKTDGAEEASVDVPETVDAPGDGAATEEEDPTPNTLTPEEIREQRFDTAFGVTYQKEREQEAKEKAAREALRPDYFTVKGVKDPPQIDKNKPFTCAWREGSPTPLHMQCDHNTKRCLVAEEAVFREVDLGNGETKFEPTKQSPSMMDYCIMTASQEEFEQLIAKGYELIPAKLEVPYGYKRDERNRAFQTYFDLNSRLLLGVYYTGVMRDEFVNGLGVELAATTETYNSYRQRRDRFRYLEGELVLAPFEARVTVFDYENGRTSKAPLLHITEFFGEPSRHDIYMNLGMGLRLLEIDYRTYQDGVERSFIDFASTRVQWEFLQGPLAEDYFQFTLGGGLGTRRYTDVNASEIYAYPELGFKGKWLASPRGLVQLGIEGNIRRPYEPASDTSWIDASVSGRAEWVALSISDQPLSFFVEPTLDYINLPAEEFEQSELRVLAGLRLSLFTPPPEDPNSDDGY